MAESRGGVLARPLATFDRWAARGPFRPMDLAIYRIVFAGVALLTSPRTSMITGLPPSTFSPPPGPFRLVPELPPVAVLDGLEIALAASLLLLAVGLWTPAVSVASGVLMIAVSGFLYSFGQIDHYILMPLVPLVLAGSGWGGRLSIDAMRRPSGREVPQWMLRLLAVLIGVAFETAALPKITAGWLDPGSQAAEGHFLRRALTGGSTGALGPFFRDLHVPWFWEALDVSTVVLEAGILLCVLSWTALRVALSVAALFHVSVLLMFGITFNTNVLAYGAFVAWSVLASRSRGTAPPARPRAVGSRGLVGIAVAALPAGALVWWLVGLLPRGPLTLLESIVTIAGGVVGIAYLGALILRAFRSRLATRPRATTS